MMRLSLVVVLGFVLWRPPDGVTSDFGTTEWLEPGSEIEFDAKEVPHHGLLNRINWFEKNERSTSKNYTLWEKADFYLLEWPGNVTLFDVDNPVVRWGKPRAKYVEDRCGFEHTGIEMRAYAYKYVYLTWGANRLTKTYTTPLTVPRSILPYTTLATLSPGYNYGPNKLNTIVAYDIGFVYDALLIAYSCGVIRVSGLEMGWAEMTETPGRPIKYSTSKGISGWVDKLEVQNCCLKNGYCPYGDMVVAYKEYSYPHVIYTSYDGGESFKRVPPLTFATGRLRVVLSYPEISRLLIVHGNETEAKMNQLIHTPSISRANESPLLGLSITGLLQGARLGMETSFVLWDDCNVWYSPDVESNATKSLFYINKRIEGLDKHRIISQHCTFGRKSALSYGMKGKIGILDANNLFFLGVDTKSNISQLVALKVDMSLLRDGKELSVHPYFDNVEQPRMLYPPKFLQLPTKLDMGRSYERRLGMRLLPKNVYPSDYILSFYKENAKLKGSQKMYALRHCQTSSLRLNRSISQRIKYYSIKTTDYLNFTISFTSKSSSLRQLMFEPRRVIRFLSVAVRPISINVVDGQYSIKYGITIKSITSSTLNKVFRVTFYTKNTLRCNVQPRVPVYVKVEKEPSFTLRDLSDDDMSHTAYLKSVDSDGGATYLDSKQLGETFKVDTCPLSKQMKMKPTSQ